MSRYCIIKPHHAGLFSLINKVITCAEIYERWSVDWRGGTLYSQPGEDLWASLFDNLYGAQPGQPITDPNDTVEYVEEYPHWRYTYKDAECVYKDRPLRDKLNAIWQTFGIKPELVREAFDFVVNNFGPRLAIGALVRAHTHRGEQRSDRSQTLQEYADAIMGYYAAVADKYPPAKVETPVLYVMAGNTETIDWFKQNMLRCEVVAHPATKRLATRDIDRHLSEPQTLADARQAMLETMILSLCHAMVHPISNIATAAAYMNPNLECILLP